MSEPRCRFGLPVAAERSWLAHQAAPFRRVTSAAPAWRLIVGAVPAMCSPNSLSGIVLQKQSGGLLRARPRPGPSAPRGSDSLSEIVGNLVPRQPRRRERLTQPGGLGTDIAVIDGAAFGRRRRWRHHAALVLAVEHLVFAGLGAVSLIDEHGSIRAAALKAGADQHDRRLRRPGTGRTAAWPLAAVHSGGEASAASYSAAWPRGLPAAMWCFVQQLAAQRQAYIALALNRANCTRLRSRELPRWALELPVLHHIAE